MPRVSFLEMGLANKQMRTETRPMYFRFDTFDCELIQEVLLLAAVPRELRGRLRDDMPYHKRVKISDPQKLTLVRQSFDRSLFKHTRSISVSMPMNHPLRTKYFPGQGEYWSDHDWHYVTFRFSMLPDDQGVRVKATPPIEFPSFDYRRRAWLRVSKELMSGMTDVVAQCFNGGFEDHRSGKGPVSYEYRLVLICRLISGMGHRWVDVFLRAAEPVQKFSPTWEFTIPAPEKS